MNVFQQNTNQHILQQGDVVLYTPPEMTTSFRGQIIDFLEKRIAYVHFIGQNRRYDLTIDISHLEFVSPAPDPSTEPPHRGRRKKRSELEHRLWTIDEIQKYEVQNIRNIEYIEFEDYSIRAWYPSPYPTEYISNRKIYVCDTCLKYYPSRDCLNAHRSKPHNKSIPPGSEIYRDTADENTQISVYEIDGTKNAMFCQCLCLLGRLFLEDKAVFYDVGHFIFYVLVKFELLTGQMSVVGFYSLDKSVTVNIIACIVVFPQYQDHGYGKTLISLAYSIARRKGVRGGPETPLSDLGTSAFKSYWRDSILTFIHLYGTEDLTTDQVSEGTSILHADVHDTLKDLELLQKIQKAKPAIIDLQTAAVLYERYKDQMRFIKEENLIWLPRKSALKTAQ